MSAHGDEEELLESQEDLAPGEEVRKGEVAAGVRGYLIGLALATLLTIASFWAAQTHTIYGPGVPVALLALAVAQMGIHLVFFLHLTTAPDNTNNILALAFGVLIACLVVFGSLWIMSHLDHNLIPEHMDMATHSTF
jgi:cytochrome o ubiquinol oxidase operon protein cyoD